MSIFLPLTRRHAFTLIELLVVIAIIAVLIGLLLPAVQKIREAASRVKCENQIKQLALACHLYHDSYQAFPAGVSTNASSISSIPTQGYAPWSVRILPFLEQQDRFGAFNTATGTFYGLTPSVGADAVASERAQQSVINPSFECPSSPHLGLSFNTNYFAVQGGGANGSSPGIYDLDAGGAWSGRFISNNGIMFPNSSISVVGIPDGASNTFLIGETRYSQLESGYPPWYASWASGFYVDNGTAGPGPFFVSGAVTMNGINSGICDPSTTACVNTTIPMTTFGSYHAGGAVFAMADGSVQFVLQSISLSVYQSLGNRSDGGTFP